MAVGVVVCLTFVTLPRYIDRGKSSSQKYANKKAILFGDSITQEGGDPSRQGWVASLTNLWIRRVDVSNRGFGGYNTRWAMKIYEEVVLSQRPDIVFIFFGANDAVVQEHKQHVPLEEYRQNLLYMAKRALDLSIEVVLLTPPPVYEPVLEERNREKGKTLLNDRLNGNTLLYVNACKEVGLQLGLPVLDNWTSLGGAGEERGRFLRDGLHLSEAGNQRVFANVEELLEHKLPRLKPENLPLFQPHWSEVVENPAILG